MNELTQWAWRWRVPEGALTELRHLLDAVPDPARAPKPNSEASTQSAIRLAAPHRGVRLWRNNVGALVDKDGRAVRFGLANESTNVNRRIKSADLIGLYPVQITPRHVGRTLGVFVSIECKRGNWRWAGSDREEAQRAWRDMVAINGGVAGFARSVDEFDAIIGGA